MNLIPERAYARSVVCLGICVSRIWQQLVAQAFALTSVFDGVGAAGITILAAVAAFRAWCVRHVFAKLVSPYTAAGCEEP